MVDVQPNSGAQPEVVLPAVLDLTTAADLKKNLLAALATGSHIKIDAGAVQRITTPCFQVFVAAANDAKKQGGALEFVNVPEVFREPAEILGLGGLLGLTEV